MNRRSYEAAIDFVLAPLGFTRDSASWFRVRGTVCELVYLGVDEIAGISADLVVEDFATEDLLSEAIPGERRLRVAPIWVGIGDLLQGSERWWRDDANGPLELSSAIRDHAPRFFDRFQSLENQAAWFGRAGPGWGSPSEKICHALTLHRMGKTQEAIDLLGNPPKLLPAWKFQVDSVRRWLGGHAPG